MASWLNCHKRGGENVVRLVHFVFQQVLEKRLVPQDWREVILMSLFKKDPKDLCDNYHRISLRSVISKVFARVLLNHLLEHIASNLLPESQCGFQPNQGMMDISLLFRNYRTSARNKDWTCISALLIWESHSIQWTEKHSGRFCQNLVALKNLLVWFDQCKMTWRRGSVMVGGC